MVLENSSTEVYRMDNIRILYMSICQYDIRYLHFTTKVAVDVLGVPLSQVSCASLSDRFTLKVNCMPLETILC